MGRRAGAVALSVAALAVGPSSAAARTWAPAADAAVHPGVMLVTNGSQCTANFVFVDGEHVYLGFAAHCAEKPSDAQVVCDETCRCDESLPLGTPVEIDGAIKAGRLAYSSWAARDPTPADGFCDPRDFALVEIDPADVPRVNPSIPFWGGPTGLRTGPLAEMEKVLAYGNSSLRGGVQTLSPSEGWSRGDTEGSAGHDVVMTPPGIFGDSGSAYLDGLGRAFGVLTNLSATNYAVDLSQELAYLRKHTSLRPQLVLGTEAFRGARLATGLEPAPPAQSDQQPDDEPPTQPQQQPEQEQKPEPEKQQPQEPQQAPTASDEPSPPPAGASSAENSPATVPIGVATQRVAVVIDGLRTRHPIKLTGRATGSVARVEVSVTTRGGGACRALSSRRVFVRADCRAAAPFVRATGTARWTLALPASAQPGRYQVRVQALDAGGHILAAARRTVHLASS